MDPTAVNEQLDRILRSETFASKEQLKRLLEILSKSMDSQPPLKPAQVIQELWPAETRTKRAADVATEINRLRHALDSYYEEEGANDQIIISLPNRSPMVTNGKHEKRWIVAELRKGKEDRTAEKQKQEPQPAAPRSVPQANPRRAVRVVAVLIALSALGTVGYFSIRGLIGPDQPKLGRLEGSALVIMNAEGKELWRKVFPEGFGPDWYYALGTHTWFADLEGKGHTSVLFVYAPAGPLSQSSTLICYSDRGKEKWRWTPGRELPEFGGSPATFLVAALGVLKATEKRPPRIVVSSQHHPWWENQMAILDPNGKMISEYWHSGALSYLTLADLYGDGKEEIVATGVNNDYLQAELVVLDTDRVFGASSEVRPNFQIHGMGAAQERLRLLFPRSDLNKALFSFNVGTEPTVEHGSIRLTVGECLTPLGCFVWYEFDKNLRLISAYAGDDFRSNHARFYQNGKDAHPFTKEEQAELQKVRCLVGCKTGFVPVGNQVP
ncbi:MAG TPA: hypothetical protein VGR55_00615 [Candidatus Acidoferrum sp.]|nr:hypothetical protein [Candidatus Acidoferrum sp.]